MSEKKMLARLFLSITLALLFSSSAFAGGYLPLSAPTLTADSDRNGDIVEVWGEVDDENVATVTITIYVDSLPMTFSPIVENGRFSIDIPIPNQVDEITIVAIDDEQLEDSVTLTF